MSPLKVYLLLHQKNLASDRRLSVWILEVVFLDGWEATLPWIPPEHLERFGQYVRELGAVEALTALDPRPISEHEKQTIVAIRDWFDQRDLAAKLASPVLAASTDS